MKTEPKPDTTEVVFPDGSVEVVKVEFWARYEGAFGPSTPVVRVPGYDAYRVEWDHRLHLRPADEATDSGRRRS